MTAVLSDTSQAEAVRRLADLDGDQFLIFVRAALAKDSDQSMWAALTDPAVANRTRTALAAVKNDVQAQMDIANTDLQAARAAGQLHGGQAKEAALALQADQADWRRRAKYFMRLVDQKIALAKSCIPQAEQQAAGSKVSRMRYAEALERLARAVAAHRDTVLSGKGGQDDDDELWNALDDITVIASGSEMTLDAWLAWVDEKQGADR